MTSPQNDTISGGEIDAFFSEYNYEHIDAAEKHDDQEEPSKYGMYIYHPLNFPAFHIEAHKDLIGIARIVQALQTIMWPSLVRQSGKGLRAPTSAQILSQLDDEEDDEREKILALFAAADGEIKEEDLAAFESWLDKDDNYANANANADVNGSEDPWTPGPHPSGTSTAPGFEDDFADFVSAPRPSDGRASALSSVDDGFGSGFGFEPLGDDEDYTSSSPSTSHPILDDGAPPSASNEDNTSPPEDAETLDKFDLSQVLSHLEAMKVQIAGIEDLDQRRRLAARVTLGIFGDLEGLDEADFLREL